MNAHIKMVECGGCLEEYQEGQLELHRGMCVVRLVFRCILCGWDYMSKEGLWNHLALHEVADESKELHYQEIKAMDKLYQCALCNDQRAYSESTYWNHIHDVHDGFFLRCSECGETFRSEELKYCHAQSNCITRDQPVTSGCDDLEVDKKVSKIFPIKSEPTTTDLHLKIPQGKQSNKSNEEIQPTLTDNNSSEQKTEVLPIVKTCEKDMPYACDICGITFSLYHTAYYHKSTKHGRVQNCIHCRRIFQIEEYQAHVSLCEKNRISCELCGSTFQLQRNLSRHMRRVHHVTKSVKDPQEKKQAAFTLSFNCDVCGKAFYTYYNCQYHKKTEHGRNHKCPHCRILFRMEEYQTHEPLCGKKKRISCEICHSKFGNSVYLARHMKRVHRGKRTLNAKNRDKMQEQTNSVVETITSPSGEILDTSLNEHTSKTKCPHCDGEYGIGKYLLNHIRNIHRPTTCNICGITFAGVEKARYHKTIKHTEPMYECGNCSKKFYFKKDFKFHSDICDPVQIDIPSHRKLEEQNQAEEIDLNMEIKVEETTLVPYDDCVKSSTISSTIVAYGDKDHEAEIKIKEECP